MKKSKNMMLISLAALGALAILGSAKDFSVANATRLARGYMEDYGGNYYADYKSTEDLYKATNELDQEIAEEGMVLLKNDGALPFRNVHRITVLGKNSVNPYNGASGVTEYTKNVYDSLEDAGYELNPIVKDFYEDDTRSGADRTTISFLGGGHYTVGETDKDDYDKSVIDSFGNYNDAAVIFLTRLGGESSLDPERMGVKDHATDPDDEARGYLQLSQNEKDLIALAKANFKKIVVVTNCPNQIELGELKDDDRINGIIHAGVPGTSGFMALGKILSGEVNPSGHLTDTFVTNIADMPSSNNFGNTNEQADWDSEAAGEGKASAWHIRTHDGNLVKSNLKSTMFLDNDVVYDSYEEGIYVGYRYYETMYSLMDMDDDWYDANVAYPFGYGLSYTQFEYSSVSIDTSELNNRNGKIKASVTVKNTGDVAGKDVVSLYYHAPYEPGEIEKSDVNLGDFAKTPLLEPGESTVLNFSIDVQDMASYDYNDANKNGFYGYELDAGAYIFTLRNNSHDVIPAKGVRALKSEVLNEGIKYRQDKNTGKNVYNQFGAKKANENSENGEPTTEDNPYDSLPREKDGIEFTPMSRKNLESFKTTKPTVEDATLKEGSDLPEIINHIFALDDLAADEEAAKKEATDNGYDQAADSTTCAVKLADMKGIDPTSDEVITKEGHPYKGKTMKAAWDLFLNQLSYNDLLTIIGNGGWSTPELKNIGKAHGIELDSPEGITASTIYPGGVGLAATWNLELARRKGRMIGNECLLKGQNAWYGPGMNMHRNPYGARNYQYYSEDPFISGKFSVAETIEVAKKGINTYAKHFAMNDSESHRFGVITYATEQAMREIYLKPFEMTIEEGGALGVMAAFPRIGLYECAINEALLKNVLRGEWDFKGIAETDAFVGSGDISYHNNNSFPSKGLNFVLGTAPAASYLGTWDASKKTITYKTKTNTDATSFAQYVAIRESAKWCLSVWSNITYLYNGLDLTAFNTKSITAFKNAATSVSIAADTTALGTKNVRYVLSSGTLPAGLSLSENGTISGTTSVEKGAYPVKVKMIADGWITNEVTITVNVGDAIGYTGSDMTNAVIGEAFEGTFTPDCVADETVYTQGKELRIVDANALPGGLTFDAATGKISGTPLVAGTYTFTIQAVGKYDGFNWMGQPVVASKTFSQTFTIVVPEEKYTVKFNENYEGGKETSQTVVDGKTVESVADPFRAGYLFTGWYTDKECTKPADLTSEITKDVTFYAGWTEDTSSKLTEAEKKIAALEQELADMKKDTTSADKIAQLEKEIADLKSSKGGCGGSVAVAASSVGALALLGVALAFKKKREDK